MTTFACSSNSSKAGTKRFASVGRVASLVALVGAVACGRRREPLPIVPKTDTWRMHGCELHAGVESDKPRVALGEPLSVTFRFTTECAEQLKMLIGGGGARPDFTVEAVDAEGNSLPLLDDRSEKSGAEGLVDFGRGHPYVQQLNIGQWIQFDKPGRYELVVKKDLAIGYSRDDIDWHRATVSTPIDVTK